jgi:integrase
MSRALGTRLDRPRRNYRRAIIQVCESSQQGADAGPVWGRYSQIIKKVCARGGLDPAQYAGHSLRSGHATMAAISGASERAIMAQTGHRSVLMVRRYIRDANLFRDNSGGKLGL